MDEVLTVIHDWNAGLIVDQGGESKDADFMGQLNIIGFDKLNAVLVGVIVDVFQFLQNIRTRFAFVVIYR